MGKGRPSKCPKCGSKNHRSRGFKYSAHGKAKDRQCKNCGRRFLIKVK